RSRRRAGTEPASASHAEWHHPCAAGRVARSLRAIRWAAQRASPETTGGSMGADADKLPENTSIIIPRLACRDPAAEIDFCVRTFDAVELNRRPGPDGSVAHALLTIGPEMIMIEAEWPTLPSRAPSADGTS